MMTKFYSVLILAAAAGMSLYADVCREIPKEAYEALCAQARREQVTYIPIRGYKCRLVPWDVDGEYKYIALARTGDTQSEIEDGQPYLSPLVWALRDLQYYERTRTSKIRGEYIPWIEGNDTPEKARTLVFRLISENAHRCVNDTYFDTDTMSFLPVLNLAGDICKAGGGLGVIDAMLAKGADPNAPGSKKRITSLLTDAIDDGRITTVQNLIRAGADPSLEANRRLLSLILNADSPTVSPYVRLGIEELLRAQKAWDVKMSHQKLSDVLPAGTACPPEATHTAEVFSAATEDTLFVTADPVQPTFSRKPVRPIALTDKVLLLERVIPSVKPEEPAVFCREKWALSKDGSELRIVRQSLHAPGGSAQCTRHIYTTKVPGVFVIGKRALVFKCNRASFILACTLFVRRDGQADFLRSQVIFPALRAPEGLLTEDAIDETEAVTQVKQEKLPLFSAEEEKAAREYVQACAVPLGRGDITPLSFPPTYIPVRGYMCLAMASTTKQRRQNDCMVAHIGTSGETTEGGLPYFSPLLWALADLRDYELHRVDPSHKLPPFPRIEGNSPEKAFKIAYDLVRQNTKDCINDTVEGISVPMLALYERTGRVMANLPASRVNLNPVLPPENSSVRDGRFETVLSKAASLGYVNVVQVMLTPEEKTDPTLEANPMLKEVLSEANQWIAYEDDEFMRSERGRRAVRLRTCAARILSAQAAWLGRARGEKLREAFCLSSYPLKNCTLRIEEIEPFLITRRYSEPSTTKAIFSRTASAGCYPIRPNQLALERIISPFGQGEKATFVRDELTLSQDGCTLTIIRHSADAPNPGDKVHSQRLIYTSSQPLIFRYGNRVLAFRRNAQGYITVCKLYTRTDDDGPFFLDRVIAPSSQSYGGELL